MLVSKQQNFVHLICLYEKNYLRKNLLLLSGSKGYFLPIKIKCFAVEGKQNITEIISLLALQKSFQSKVIFCLEEIIDPIEGETSNYLFYI